MIAAEILTEFRVIIIICLAIQALIIIVAHSVGYDRGWDQHETHDDRKNNDQE